jgi:hypothetical protein
MAYNLTRTILGHEAKETEREPAFAPALVPAE